MSVTAERRYNLTPGIRLRSASCHPSSLLYTTPTVAHTKLVCFFVPKILAYTKSMATFSFDVVSEYDKAKIINVFDQAVREIGNRYDFKNTPAAIEWLNADKTGIKVTGNGDWQVDAILDIVRKKLATSDQSQKILDTAKEPTTANLKTTKEVPFKQGLDQDQAKKITKLLRDTLPKVKTQIQGDSVRVMSSSKDDLQAVMQLLRTQDFDFPLNFTNYR